MASLRTRGKRGVTQKAQALDRITRMCKSVPSLLAMLRNALTMPMKLLYAGARHDVLLFVEPSGRCQVEEYLERLDDASLRQIDAIITRAADDGPIFREEGPCRRIRGELFSEFKARRGQRVFWFQHGRAIVLFYGFTKRQQRTPAREIANGRRRFVAASQELETELEQ